MAKELTKSGDKAAEDQANDPGRMPTKAAVTKLGNSVGLLNQKAAKIRGEIGSLIKTAEADDNIHRGAFKAAMKERGMEPDERANYQRHLAKYRQQLGIELQGDLLKDAPREKSTGGPGK